jgi:hypothetical protein
MYSVQKGGVTERDEDMECTERKAERNDMMSQMKAEEHSRIIC